MNILSHIPSPFSIDGAYVWFQVLSLLFLTATILTGAGTIITGFIANNRIANALAVQQRRAANAEIALRELEQEREPRHLTLEQGQKLSEILRKAINELVAKGLRKPPPDRITFIFLYAIEADDTAYFSEEIRRAMEEGGLIVDAFQPTDLFKQQGTFGSEPQYGITIVSTAADAAHDPPEADVLEKALTEIGLTDIKRIRKYVNNAAELPEGHNPVVHLLVGARRNPRARRLDQ